MPGRKWRGRIATQPNKTNPMKAKQVFVYYSASGYCVHVDGEPEYVAGNNRHDSSQWAMPGSSAALPLRLIRKLALQTAKGMAEEKSEGLRQFAGIERNDDLFL